MRLSPRLLSCWPGLPRLWICGDGWSLVGAVVFGVVLNLLLVSGWLRPQWIPPAAVLMAWMAVLGFWVVSVIQCWRQWEERFPSLGSVADRGLFLRAQSEYLQGHWFEAEAACQQMLQQSQRDVEARLLLATLYRHTNRHDAAVMELERIEQIDGGEKWRSEISAERRLIQRKAEARREAAVAGRRTQELR